MAQGEWIVIEGRIAQTDTVTASLIDTVVLSGEIAEQHVCAAAYEIQELEA